MPDLLRAESNQRLDLPDFSFSTDDTPQAFARQVPGEVLTNPLGQRSWILSGFGISNPGGNQVQVDKGSAILSYREGGQVLYGMVSTEGDASKIVTINNPGTYSIYIRFEYVQGDSGSRVFWNAAGLGSEFAQTVNTRRKANWSLRVELASPGAEWVKIGEVIQASMTITDQRDLFFEGRVDNTYANVWGGGSDRDADRQGFGIRDLQTFTAAVRTCLEDIKGQGLRRWWDPGIGGLNVGFDGAPAEDKIRIGNFDFALDGSVTNNPRLQFDGGDYFEYDRTLEEYTLTASGTVCTLNAAFNTFTGQVLAQGGTATPGNADSVRACSQLKQILSWGRFSVTGVLQAGHYNIDGNATKGGAGIYNINLDIAIDTDSAICASTDVTTAARIVQARVVTSTSLQVRTYDAAGTLTDASFTVMVAGTA